MKTITFPAMGHYTECFAKLAEDLGFEPVIPPKTNQETIKLGVRHSSDMVCFPFKTTLGNLIQGLDAGAQNILALGVNQNNKKEGCRFLFYYHIQEQILRKLGYDFNMYYIQGPGLNVLKSLKRINPKLNLISTIKIARNFYKMVKDVEEREYKFEKKDINIGLIGEAYTLWEPGVNYDIVDKLKKMGIGVDLSITLSWYLLHRVHLADTKKGLNNEVKKYFPKRTGGHGWESIVNTIDYAKKGFDGVIHLLPLSCMPETLVEMVINMIGEDYNIPVYRFPIDENRFEAGFNTRLETFIKLLRRNKK